MRIEFFALQLWEHVPTYYMVSVFIRPHSSANLLNIALNVIWEMGD